MKFITNLLGKSNGDVFIHGTCIEATGITINSADSIKISFCIEKVDVYREGDWIEQHYILCPEISITKQGE